MARDTKLALCRSGENGQPSKCPICRGRTQCRVEEKTDEQLDYVISSITENQFLRACPGSGKTEVVGMKAAHEITQWTDNTGIAVLTFTNNAADEITERVCQFAGVDRLGHPHFVGTIDSWLHGYIVHPFAHFVLKIPDDESDKSLRIIAHDSNADFLNLYKTKYQFNKTGNVPANQYYFDPNHQLWIFESGDRSKDAARRSIALQDWQRQDLQDTKDKFYRSRFATYQDAESIALRLLQTRASLSDLLAKRFPLVIVDECQDLSATQMSILKVLKDNGSTLHFVGDLEQAIYQFKEVAPEKVAKFAEDNHFTPKHLSKNFRSGTPIISLCEKLVANPVKATQGKEVDDCSCHFVCFSKENMSTLPEWFANYLEKADIPLLDSTVVARSWSTVAKLRPSGQDTLSSGYQFWLAAAVKLWQSNDPQSLPEAIKLVGRFISRKYLGELPRNASRDYCPTDIDNFAEWRLFLAAILDGMCQEEALSSLDHTWKNWISNFKKYIPQIIGQALKELKSAPDNVLISLEKTPRLQVPAKKGTTSVISSLEHIENSKKIGIPITTIHQVKGLTKEATLVVSALSKQGDGHWQQWLKDSSSEAARLAYVASSRPRKLLIWAIPEPKSEEEKKPLLDLGFSEITFTPPMTE